MQVMDVGNVGSGTMDLLVQRALVPRAWLCDGEAITRLMNQK